ncbi:MAG: hypothetical protein HKN44_04155 [Ilumatobacter sp.]|nr:hypothetical protein [Ilumatobacter sp.]
MSEVGREAEAPSSRPQTWLDKHWPAVVGVALLICAVVLAGVALFIGFDVDVDGRWWVFAIGAMACGVAAFAAFRSSPRPEPSRVGSYWPVPVGALLLVSGLVFGVVTVVEVQNYRFDDIAPWLFGGGAALCLMLALVAISYAPPGPNWIERIAGIDGASVLLIIGAAMTAYGTLGLFDFGSEGGDPSNWWVALVAAGFVIALVGIARGDEQDEAADVLRSSARDAARSAREAVEQKARAASYYEHSLTLPMPSATLAAVAAAKESAAKAADVATRSAEEAAAAVARAAMSAEQAAQGLHDARLGAAAASVAVMEAAVWPPPVPPKEDSP